MTQTSALAKSCHNIGNSPYRTVPLSLWDDERWLSLTKIAPSAQSLYLWLLAGPLTTPVPGLIVAGPAALAERIGWEIAQVEECLGELVRVGLVEYDWSARTLWLPQAIHEAIPDNPKVVMGWQKWFKLVPRSDLRTRALKHMCSIISKRKNKSFVQPLRDFMRDTEQVKPYPIPYAIRYPIPVTGTVIATEIGERSEQRSERSESASLPLPDAQASNGEAKGEKAKASDGGILDQGANEPNLVTPCPPSPALPVGPTAKEEDALVQSTDEVCKLLTERCKALRWSQPSEQCLAAYVENKITPGELESGVKYIQEKIANRKRHQPGNPSLVLRVILEDVRKAQKPLLPTRQERPTSAAVLLKGNSWPPPTGEQIRAVDAFHLPAGRLTALAELVDASLAVNENPWDALLFAMRQPEDWRPRQKVNPLAWLAAAKEGRFDLSTLTKEMPPAYAA